MINNDKNLLAALITKYGKSGVNSAINRLNESQESKSIDAAKKLLIDNGYTPERADKFIRIDLRNDFPILRDKKSGKFILGVTRMFLKNELRDARTISQLNTTLKYISDESHYDEYNRNLNNETAKTLIDRFNIEVERDIEKQKDKIQSKEYTKNDEYDIVKINSFEEAKKYSRYVSWCITKSNDMYNNYIHNGIGQYYFILKKDFKKIKKVKGKNCPLDEYGLSMIAVSVDEKGQLNTCTCRWNHDNGGNEKILNSEQISDLIGQNFYDVFKPNDNYKKLIDKIILEIQQGERDKDLLFNNIYKIRINNKYTLIDANNKCEIESIIIPDSITSIGNSAFYDCTSLTSVTIPDSVTSIGNKAFYNCSSLTSITIPEGVTSIGGSAFRECSSLTSITIPESVTSIGNNAFSGCSSLTSITLPEGITSIGDCAFQYCSSLTSITIPESVTSIGNNAFSGCSSLTSITIPESVSLIGDYVFYYCTKLRNITIPEGVTSIGDWAFYACKSLTSITIPESVTSIGYWAFFNCASLKSVTIPNSITEIGTRAFPETCKVIRRKINENKNMKNNDKTILESLISKYGKSNVNLAINRLNENNENPKSGIFIEYHDHLSCDAFRILVLDNGVNVLKNDPLEIECEGQYSGKRYIENLELKNGNDYIEVNYVGDLWEKSLCLISVVKALHIKYPELPIYCFTMGWNTWKGGYVDEQKAFNRIFSEYLRGISFEFIPGTMGEFLKSDMNESLNENFGQTINGTQNTTIEDYERYWDVNIEINYFNKNNNRCVMYMWLPEDKIVNEIPELLLEDGIVFERNGMNYWFEPNPSDCYLTYNGTCISLGGYAYPEY